MFQKIFTCTRRWLTEGPGGVTLSAVGIDKPELWGAELWVAEEKGALHVSSEGHPQHTNHLVGGVVVGKDALYGVRRHVVHLSIRLYNINIVLL